MSTRQEAKAVRRRLRGTVIRAQELSLRCASQVADGDLRQVDRETAEKRMDLAMRTALDLERSLDRIDEALT